MTMNRHEPFEELISASLRHGDLTREERERLDRHLDTCAECRATLATFADQRRIVAGVRHVAPPRDLSARVRAGIEAGAFAPLPWWRRPVVMFAGVGGGLAVVAGAFLAIALLNEPADGPSVGQASPSASAAEPAASATIAPTLPPPEPSVAPSSEPSLAPTPSLEPTPIPSPEPAIFLAVTGPVDNQLMTVRDGETGDLIVEAGAPLGEPIAAELSPDGQWLAYITVLGESGLNEIRATRIAEAAPSDDPDAARPIESPVRVGDTVVLGQSAAGGPFLEHLFWSADSRYMAFTSANDDGTDVWVFQPGTGEADRLTETGDAYAGSFAFSGSDASALWVSVADDDPPLLSYLVELRHDTGQIAAIDPAESELRPAEDVFQPIISPNGAFVVFWSGTMDRFGDEWLLTEAGTPWLAQNSSDGQGGFEFTSARPLFSDLTIGREAFASAAFTWGGDSDAYAVWDIDWRGVPQSGDDYPSGERVYFGHATDPRGLTMFHALDADDLPPDTFVVDVKVAPTGRHLVITAAYPRAGVLDPPRADLLLVERNTGSVRDEVTEVEPDAEGWFGPAAFDDGR
jgi:Putative zinc-finger